MDLQNLITEDVLQAASAITRTEYIDNLCILKSKLYLGIHDQ